jgi:hypothetical protein
MKQKYIFGDLVEAWIGINTGSQFAEVVGYNPLYQEYILTNWYIEETRGYISITEDRITPIPLTPKILEKSGWKLSHGFYWSPNEEGAGVGLSSQTGYVWESYIGRHPLRSNINTVSDLQHLLFGLGLNHEMEV